jgi:tetratricopeptide (TPR) repeat protein
MNPSPLLQRALVLNQQGRHDLAEKELRQHLASEPNDGFAHGLLAISCLEQERLKEAEQSAREAIGNAPDFAFTHYALARVLSSRNREDEAVTAIQEAIRLEPTDADYHGTMAGIEFDRRNWPAALAAAETGLQFDPEHVACNNLRAMALVKLGRKAEAGATIERTLARDPDDAFSHANQGWTLLEQGQRKPAMEHFRESLRLDPNNSWAQAGLVEAIKAGNPVYAIMLKYFLWTQKLSDRARWGILLGGYFGSRLLAGLSASNPEWSPWIMPLRALYIGFALLTWLAHPFFNLLLFLHPFGRHALNKDQRSQATWVGLCLALALGSLAAAPVTRSGFESFAANYFFLASLRLALLFNGGLGRSQTRDGHAIRRAAHVGQADAMAELDGVRVAAVFAADAQLDVRTVACGPSHRDLHQLADASLVNRGKRVLLDDFVLGVSARNEPESSRLMPRQVWVRSFVPKLKNSAVCAISSAVSAPRGISIIVPTHVSDLHLLFLLHTSLGDLVNDRDLEVEFLLEADERDHDFRLHLETFFVGDIRRGFKARRGPAFRVISG